MSDRKRIHFIDEVRGFCVLCMVFYHAMYTLGFMFGLSTAQKMFWFFSFISPAFAFAFIMMCGISSTLSRSNFKRSLPILGAALAVTLVSLFITPDAPILFGILHLLGVSVFLYSLTERFFNKIPAAIGLAVCFLLFLLTYNLPNGYLGFEGVLKLSLPKVLYNENYLFFFGFIKEGIAYSDYFPLIPWLFAFLTGVFAGKLLKGRYPEFMYKERAPFFTMLGTNAFIIYVIHQPIIFGVSYILSLFGGN
ncbi:MAG: DUF1624 domain-containing protein [Clostridia bacterium]|nr:DUF1624 domain-containing protein [Clostridia bacterium]